MLESFTGGGVGASAEQEGSFSVEDLYSQEAIIDRLSQHVECCHAQHASQVLPLTMLTAF